MSEAETLLDAVLGDGRGYLALAFGARQYFEEKRGNFKHHDWREVRYVWPSERDEALRAIEQATAEQPTDVYWAASLRRTDQRRKGDGVAPRALWADLDGKRPTDEALLFLLNALVVESGSPGHRHVYVLLAEAVSLAVHERLNRALAERLGGDAKWYDSALLRVPGTSNHKHKPPLPVTLLEGGARVWDVAELAGVLGVPLDEEADEPTPAAPEDVTAEQLPDLTRRVQRELDRYRHMAPGDASGAFHALVGACKDDGWTPGQALTLAREWTHTPERYADRLEHEVARSWEKLDEPAAAVSAPAESDGEEGAGQRRLKVTLASQVTMRRVRWLWDLRVVLGGLTLLAGREGLGKSTIAVWMCAAVTRGELDGELNGEPRTVIYVNSEDARDYTIVPRLRAAGADLDRVIFVDAVMPGCGEDGEDLESSIVLPGDARLIAALVEEHKAALVVLDAATSTIDSKLDGDRDRQMRQGLETIGVRIGERTGAAVLGIVHFGKRDSNDTGKLILGSIAWSQVARSVLAVALDEENGSLVITRSKGNLGIEPPSLAARIVSVAVDTDEGVTHVGRCEVVGETKRDARELLGPPPAEQDRHAPDRESAEAWLTDYLSVVSARATVVKDEAPKEISERTLKRAAEKIGVQYKQRGFPRVTWWTLATVGPRPHEGNVVHVSFGPTGPTEADLRKQDGPTGPDSQLGHPHVHGPTEGSSAVDADEEAP